MDFDEQKIKVLNNDFSLFHPSLEQLIAFYEMTSLVAKELKLDEKTIRNVTIKSVVKYQQKTKRFHYENRELLPQMRVVATSDISKILSIELSSLLSIQNDENTKLIEKVLEDSFNYYMDHHVNR